MGARVLVVDDESKIVELARLYLERDGHQVLVASDGEGALAAFRRHQPDLIVLDIMMPGIDGIEVCRRVRRDSDVPIIMLTARAEEVDKLVGLEVGADDYLTKPFSPRELAARVRTVLRRAGSGRDAAPEVVEVDGLRIDISRHEVECAGERLELTPTEFRLLFTLARQPGRVFSRGQLLDEAAGDGFEGYERTVDAHVKNLRRKLGASRTRCRIETVYGLGYRLSIADA